MALVDRTKHKWDEHQIRKYDIKTEQIPRMTRKEAEGRIALSVSNCKKALVTVL